MSKEEELVKKIKRRDKKTKAKMKVSGRKVFDLQKAIIKKKKG